MREREFKVVREFKTRRVVSAVVDSSGLFMSVYAGGAVLKRTDFVALKSNFSCFSHISKSLRDPQLWNLEMSPGHTFVNCIEYVHTLKSACVHCLVFFSIKDVCFSQWKQESFIMVCEQWLGLGRMLSRHDYRMVLKPGRLKQNEKC